MPIDLSGVHLADPQALFDQAFRKSLPTTPWYGDANSFRSPVGRGYGSAGLLIRKVDFDKLASAIALDALDLTFADERGGAKITFRNLRVLTPTNVLPSDDLAGASILVLKLADRRYSLMQVPAGRRYNSRYADGNFDPSTLDAGSAAFTWATLVAHLWAKMAAVYPWLSPTVPAFPAPPASTPQGFAERRLVEAVGTGVDRLRADARIVRPARHQAPLEQRQSPQRGIPLERDDGDGLARCDVVARFQLGDRLGEGERLGDVGDGGEGEASAHAAILDRTPGNRHRNSAGPWDTPRYFLSGSSSWARPSPTRAPRF